MLGESYLLRYLSLGVEEETTTHIMF